MVSGGKENKVDFITLGNYLGEERRKVYYLGEELDEYALFYGYIAQDYMWVRTEELDKISEGGIVVVKTASQQLPEGYKKVDLGCERIEVWEKTG